MRGRGTFVDNMRPDGVLFAAFVRTPFAHATITGIDVTEAREAPGVIAVLTADDLDLEPGFPFFPTNKLCARPPLAAGKVRFVGEAVAVVVAETKAQAVDATELVDVRPARGGGRLGGRGRAGRAPAVRRRARQHRRRSAEPGG